MKRKMLKEKIKEKRRIVNESYCKVLMKVIGKIRVNFGDLYIQNNLVVVRRK